MTKKNEIQKNDNEVRKEVIAAAIMAALVQHGDILLSHPKQNFVKKESEWKKRRTSGLR